MASPLKRTPGPDGEQRLAGPARPQGPGRTREPVGAGADGLYIRQVAYDNWVGKGRAWHMFCPTMREWDGCAPAGALSEVLR